MKIDIEVTVNDKVQGSTKIIVNEAEAVYELARLINSYLRSFPGNEPLHITVQR